MRTTLANGGLSAALAVLAMGGAAQAHANGSVIGRSVSGCGGTGCHAQNPGATVTLMGPQSVATGSVNTYTLRIASTFAGFTGGGFDIGVTGPGGTALAVNAAQANTRLNGADLVMTSRLAASGGALTVTFDLATPAAGAVNITAAGNATNGVGNTGDAWAVTALAVTVAGAAPADAGTVTPTDSGAGPRTDAGTSTSTDTGAVGGEGGLERFDPTMSYGYGGCSVGAETGARGSAGAGLLLGLALAGLLGRRRRHV